jgi:hypothetical protein
MLPTLPFQKNDENEDQKSKKLVGIEKISSIIIKFEVRNFTYR